MYIGESGHLPIEKLLGYRMHWGESLDLLCSCLPSKWGPSVNSLQSPGQCQMITTVICYMEAGKEPIQLWYGGLTPMRKGVFITEIRLIFCNSSIQRLISPLGRIWSIDWDVIHWQTSGPSYLHAVVRSLMEMEDPTVSGIYCTIRRK
jgi:hypothetical protein